MTFKIHTAIAFALIALLPAATPPKKLQPYKGIDGSAWKASPTKVPWALKKESHQYRFEVRENDNSAWDIAHRHHANRAEISSGYELPIGKPIRFGFGLQVAPGAPITSRWLNLGQGRPTLDTHTAGISPFWQQTLTQGNVFRIIVRSSTQQPLTTNPRPHVLFEDSDFKRDHTYHFRYRMVYDPHGNGALDVWRDGKRIVKYRGALGYVTSKGPYLKLGIYRDPAPETLVAFFSEIYVNFDQCRDNQQCVPARSRF